MTKQQHDAQGDAILRAKVIFDATMRVHRPFMTREELFREWATFQSQHALELQEWGAWKPIHTGAQL